MCLMPVDPVYGVHSGRYGIECTNDMRDCLKPLLTLLFSSRLYPILNQAADRLWSEQGRHAFFSEFWAWLWVHNGDHVYGILKVLGAILDSFKAPV